MIHFLWPVASRRIKRVARRPLPIYPALVFSVVYNFNINFFYNKPKIKDKSTVQCTDHISLLN